MEKQGMCVGTELRPLLFSVNDPVPCLYMLSREPPSGVMRLLGQWSWLESWGEAQLTEVVNLASFLFVILGFLQALM